MTTTEPTTPALLRAADRATGSCQPDSHPLISNPTGLTRAPADLPPGALVFSGINALITVRDWCKRHRYRPDYDHATGKIYAVPMPRLVTDGGQRVAP